jgi:hypothetical protein
MTRLFFGVALGLVVPVAASAVTFRVPEQIATIQEAIDLCAPSQVDTVLLAPGHYTQRCRIRGKNLVLRGRDGAEATTIDGQSRGNVLTINYVNRTCSIEDLTITGGLQTTLDSVGTAIWLNEYASPTIQRCRLVGNRARVGGGVAGNVYCEPLVRDCWISDNEGGAVFLELGPEDRGHTWAEFENVAIVRNHGSAIHVRHGARAWFRNCTIAYNDGDGVVTDQLARVRIYNCLVTHNNGGGIRRRDNTVCFGLTCNDVYANPAGNYLGANDSDTCFPGRGAGDVSIDPCYQNIEMDNFHLAPTSPLCSLRLPGGCGLVGAYDDPCVGTPGECLVHVEPATWSGVKLLYR